MSTPVDLRARSARATLQQNREELRAAFAAPAARRDAFPRSATFRWLSAHVTPRALASTALSAAVLRRSFLLQLLSRWLQRNPLRD